MAKTAKKWKVEISWSGVRKSREVFRGRVSADTPEEAIHLVATEKFRLWGGRVRAEMERTYDMNYVVQTFIGNAPQNRFVARVEEVGR